MVSFSIFVLVNAMVVFSAAHGSRREYAKGYEVQGEPMRRTFWCPTCQNTRQETCDAALTNTTCTKAEFCMAFWDEKIFLRKCVNGKMLKLLTKDCKNITSNEWICNGKRHYNVTWCDQSGCRATAKVTDDFWCPTCQNSSLESCDANLTKTICPKADVCMAIQAKNVFSRKCVNNEFLEMITKNCENVGDKMRKCNKKRRQYHVTWCEQSGCRADFRFECHTCPVCNSSGECDDKMALTKCPRATRCFVLRFHDINTVNSKTMLFTRRCVNEMEFKLFSRACKKKQGCKMATCKQSGCKPML